MTIQTDHSEPLQPKLPVEIPTVVEFAIPPESLVGFEADYEKVCSTWPADLPTTTDHFKMEQFVQSAHALVRRWLPEELVSRLESFIYDPMESPGLVIRGLPIDKDLPPTGKDLYIKKEGQSMSETWLVGIGRIVGQPFILSYARGSRTGMGMLVRELYPTQEEAHAVTVYGSRALLDYHVDFGHEVIPSKFPHVLGFIGIRGQSNQEGKSLICNNRKLYKLLDRSDIEVLRSQKIVWNVSPGMEFSQCVIKGPESNPTINLFEENLPGMGGFDKVVSGSPEALAAYKRTKEIAATLVEGPWLGGGDVYLLNQKKANHGRSPFDAKFDGKDRWVQRCYINSGGFWEAGLTEWPSRTIPS